MHSLFRILGLSLFTTASVAQAPLPSNYKTILNNTDVQVMEMRRLLDRVDQDDKEIRAQLGDVKVRMGTDEGMATGAFIILGILETLGLLTRIRPDSSKSNT